ncbi:MAG TPA: RES family NAD+ phosphorylase [Candidatus Methylomirabilis sp.]|nr:RES family NAD+ phosphorylase [Candidatus Methylomirabilis sp.]
MATSFSRSAGGRWNPPGEFGALYTTTVEGDIEREMERAAEKRGITPKDLLPRDIVTIAVSLHKVLDLTDPAILRDLKFHADDLTKDAYEHTCDLGRAVFKAGIEGIVVPSATGKGKNLVIYADNLSPKSSVSEKRRRKMEL